MVSVVLRVVLELGDQEPIDLPSPPRRRRVQVGHRSHCTGTSWPIASVYHFHLQPSSDSQFLDASLVCFATLCMILMRGRMDSMDEGCETPVNLL